VKLAACRIVAVLAVLGVAAPGAKAEEAWFDATFDQNMQACMPLERPGWCQDWFAALDTRLMPFGNRSVPEWRTVPAARNADICAALLPPAWCTDWVEFSRQTSTEEPYRAAAKAAQGRAQAAAEAAAKALRAAQEKIRPFRAAAQKVATRQQTAADVALVQEWASNGDREAMELLAWMHVHGRGVPQDFAQAYTLYAQLVMGGRDDLRTNMDGLWPLMSESQRDAMYQRFGRTP